MRHGVKSLRESWRRAECAAGTDAGRTWAAEGHGRRLIFCTRNRTDPISSFAKNGDAPVTTMENYPKLLIRAYILLDQGNIVIMKTIPIIYVSKGFFDLIPISTQEHIHTERTPITFDYDRIIQIPFYFLDDSLL